MVTSKNITEIENDYNKESSKGGCKMAFLTLEVTFQIFDSYSLKDKRSTVKSIIHRMKNKYPVSLAEVADQDLLNQACIGIAVANSSKKVAQQIVDQLLREIESLYEIEIIDTNYYE